MLHILTTSGDATNIEYNFEDDVWGMYNHENDTDKYMYEMISHNKNAVSHYFRQFGFGMLCVKEDLKQLTLYWHEELPTKSLTQRKLPNLI